MCTGTNIKKRKMRKKRERKKTSDKKMEMKMSKKSTDEQKLPTNERKQITNTTTARADTSFNISLSFSPTTLDLSQI